MHWFLFWGQRSRADIVPGWALWPFCAKGQFGGVQSPQCAVCEHGVSHMAPLGCPERQACQQAVLDTLSLISDIHKPQTAVGSSAQEGDLSPQWLVSQVMLQPSPRLWLGLCWLHSEVLQTGAVFGSWGHFSSFWTQSSSSMWHISVGERKIQWLHSWLTGRKLRVQAY